MKLFNSQFSNIFSEGEMRRNILSLLRYLAFLVAVILVYASIFHMIMAREGTDPLLGYGHLLDARHDDDPRVW